MLALLLVAVSLGMSNFTASIAIGLSGVDARLRLRIAVSFGVFEAGMPILGLLIGRQAASALGSHADLIAGCLVITTGIYSLLNPLDSEQQPPSASQPIGRLLTTGFGLSIDNLVVGFALGAYNVSFPLAAVVIGAISIAIAARAAVTSSLLRRRRTRSKLPGERSSVERKASAEPRT